MICVKHHNYWNHKIISLLLGNSNLCSFFLSRLFVHIICDRFKQVFWLGYQAGSRWIHTVMSLRSIINWDNNLTSWLFQSGTNYLSLLFLWMSSPITWDVLLLLHHHHHHHHKTIIVDLLLLPVMKPTRSYCNTYGGSLYLNYINTSLSKFFIWSLI